MSFITKFFRLQQDGRRDNLLKIWEMDTIKRSTHVNLKQVLKERDTLTEVRNIS